MFQHRPLTTFRYIFFLTVIFNFALSGCSINKSENSDVDTNIRQYHEEANFVDTAILKKDVFFKEIISNGKLKAVRKSQLKFRISGELSGLLVKNGSNVKAGQVLAKLSSFEYQQKLNQAETALKNASVEMEDMLVSYAGHKEKDSIDNAIKETFASRSGYLIAESEYRTAKYNLEGTILKSPFSGKIANLKHHVFEQVNSDDPFCLIIDDSEFEVEFYLLESEIADVQIHDPLTISPFSENSSYTANIVEINPLINENGLASIKAHIKNHGLLWEGMNVKVIIKKEVPDQLVVPKTSIVLRQNQEVLFKYENGKAHWIYIKTNLENSKFYTIFPDNTLSLNIGDTVITSGNLNLAHESKVSIRRSQ